MNVKTLLMSVSVAVVSVAVYRCVVTTAEPSTTSTAGTRPPQRAVEARNAGSPSESRSVELAVPASPSHGDVSIDTAEEAATALRAVFDDESFGKADQRSMFLEALRQTGPSTEEWTYRARDVARRRTSIRGVVLQQFECYRAGCYVEIGASDRTALAEATSTDLRTDLQSRWDGGTIATPIEERSATAFVVSLILVRP